MNLSADRELDLFYGRKDEIGMISQTVHDVCGYLRKTVDDIGRILGEMADGNIAVAVVRNEEYYIGDFWTLAESLKMIRANLTRMMRDISGISNQVDSGAEQLSAGGSTLSQRAVEQAASVKGLAENVTKITAQIKDSAVLCTNLIYFLLQ